MYRAKPVTQRDGSKLENSNCRMASVACGLDFNELGGKTSTGARMRSFTVDQSGGTDSGDAAQAWQRGYGETLLVRDGRTWDDAVRDLQAGRLVHIDVWHAAANVCISGSGQYGHTMAIAPESSPSGWLVSDPWCKPGRWASMSATSLRAGAEAWGRKIFETAGREADWPPRAGWPRIEDPDDIRWAILRRIVRALMTRYHAGGDDDPTPPPADTGGPQRIMYTTTAAHPEVVDMPGVQLSLPTPFDGTAVVSATGASWVRIWDGHLGAAAVGFTKKVSARCQFDAPFTTPGGSVIPAGTKAVVIGDDLAVLLEKDVQLTVAPGADCAEAIRRRDIEWEDWLLDGAPGSE